MGRIGLLLAMQVLVACNGMPVANPKDSGAAHPATAAAPEDLAATISDALRRAPGIEFWQVRVQVLHDTVYLYGLVETYPERANIEQLARDTSAGRKVVNAIEVRGRY